MKGKKRREVRTVNKQEEIKSNIDCLVLVAGFWRALELWRDPRTRMIVLGLGFL